MNKEASYNGLHPTALREIASGAERHDVSSRVYPTSDLEEEMGLQNQDIILQSVDNACATSEQPHGGKEAFTIAGNSLDDIFDKTALHVGDINSSGQMEEPVSQVSFDAACDANDYLTGYKTLNGSDSLLDKSLYEIADILTHKYLSDDTGETGQEKDIDSKKHRENRMNEEKKNMKCENNPPKEASKSTRKRSRSTINGITTHKIVDDEIKLFRHSQKVLLKEAKHVSMKDIMLRSFTSLTNLEDGGGGSSSPESPRGWDNSKGNAKFMADAVSLASTSQLDMDVEAETGTQGAFPNFDGADGCNLASLSMVSPTALSSWSPTIADSITSRFIATAQQQKKRNVERLLPLELTYSQRTHKSKSGLRGFTNHSSSLGAILEESCSSMTWAGPGGNLKPSSPRSLSDNDEELIIGANDDVNSQKTDKGGFNGVSDRYPGDSVEGALVNPSERKSEDYLASLRLPSYLGSGDLSSGNQNGMVDGDFGDDNGDDDESSQAAIVRAIKRKHEMWKLKHREIRGQRLVEQDERCKRKNNLSKVVSRSHSANLPAQIEIDKMLHAAPPGGSVTLSTGFAGGTEVHPERSFETLAGSTSASTTFSTVSRIQTTHNSNSQSIQHVNLSQDDLTMIRRLNSFDHTATKRVVVFGSTKRKE